MIHNYEITGMHCNNCVGKVTKGLEAVPGVTKATVTLNPRSATVEMSTHVSTGTLNAALKPIGGYSLSEKTTVYETLPSNAPLNEESLKPLFIIVGYLIGGVLLRASIANDYSFHSLMTNFMGGFFVLFSLFKMIDVKGFAQGYATYDVLAKRSEAYAKSYPFIELGLGVLYLTGTAPFFTNLITVVLMTIGSIGVVQALRQNRAIQCACLGTALKLPMTKVTLAEDLVMGLMAAGMLFAS